MTNLTKSDLPPFVDFCDSLTWYTMVCRITIRVDGVSSYKNSENFQKGPNRKNRAKVEREEDHESNPRNHGREAAGRRGRG